MTSRICAFLCQIVLLLSIALISGVHSFSVTPTSSHQKGSTESLIDTNFRKGTLSYFSPCKINLFLRILRKRDDGYHDLASLFQAIGFGDTLELTRIQEGSTDEFTCNMEGVPTDSSNLVLRAIQLMRDRTGIGMFFEANLIKECPAQAGLGGGSANAATAMWAANEMMGRPATLEQVSHFICSHSLSLVVF
jgi:hypothetical protein